MILDSIVEVALLFARLGLTIIFCMAGIAKLSDLEGSKQAVRDFGVPPRLAGPVSVLLPIFELVIAAGLLPLATARYAAAASAGILILFSAAMVALMLRGKRPDCGCFGQAWPDPVSGRTLARNATLLLLSLFVLLAPGPLVSGPFSAVTTGQAAGVLLAAALFGLVAIQSWFIFRLLRKQGRLLLCLETMEQHLEADAPPVWYAPENSLPVGAPAPGFRLPDAQGELHSLEEYFVRGLPVMLVFTSPRCLSCQSIIPELGTWERRFAREMLVVVITQGTPAENEMLLADSSLRHVLFQRLSEVAQAYEVTGTPSAVLVGRQGELLSSVAAGEIAIRRLIREQVVEPIGAGLLR
jgi:peroxiredoxin